jgi:hypothetical protein
LPTQMLHKTLLASIAYERGRTWPRCSSWDHAECMYPVQCRESRYDTRYTQSYENQSPCGSGQRHRGVLTSLVVLRCARRRHCETSSGVQRRNAMQCESARRTTYRRLQPCPVSDDDCGSIHVEAAIPNLCLGDLNGLPRPIECSLSEFTVGL